MNTSMTPEGRAEIVDTIDRALSMLAAAETIKKTGGAVEIAGVRIEPCDERGETLTLRAFQDAAEARDRVRELLTELEATPLVGSSSYEQWEFDTRRVVGRELRAALDGDS